MGHCYLRSDLHRIPLFLRKHHAKVQKKMPVSAFSSKIRLYRDFWHRSGSWQQPSDRSSVLHSYLPVLSSIYPLILLPVLWDCSHIEGKYFPCVFVSFPCKKYSNRLPFSQEPATSQIFIPFFLQILLQFLLLLPPLPAYLFLPKSLLPERLLQSSSFPFLFRILPSPVFLFLLLPLLLPLLP